MRNHIYVVFWATTAKQDNQRTSQCNVAFGFDLREKTKKHKKDALDYNQFRLEQ